MTNIEVDIDDFEEARQDPKVHAFWDAVDEYTRSLNKKVTITIKMPNGQSYCAEGKDLKEAKKEFKKLFKLLKWAYKND